MKTFRIVPLTIISVALFITVMRAQDPPQPPQPKNTETKEPKDPRDKKGDQRKGAEADYQKNNKEDIFSIETDLVLMDVQIIDQENQVIYQTFKKEDFTVFEDKVKQEIENVSREEVPLSFGMVIDNSGSMRSRLQVVSDATISLIKQMRDDDEAFIARFFTETELMQDFTPDKKELEDAVAEMYTSGGTALLDAIIATSDYAQERGKNRRKAIIIISDGLDRNSAVKERQVIEAVKENEVQLYLVGFIDKDELKGGVFGKSPEKKAMELMIRLAEESGGRAFFPTDTAEMPAIAAQIAKDLRTQFVLSYYPSNEKRDGTFRNVKVTLNNPGKNKWIARTRLGYYARTPEGKLPTGKRRTKS